MARGDLGFIRCLTLRSSSCGGTVAYFGAKWVDFDLTTQGGGGGGVGSGGLTGRSCIYFARTLTAFSRPFQYFLSSGGQSAQSQGYYVRRNHGNELEVGVALGDALWTGSFFLLAEMRSHVLFSWSRVSALHAHGRSPIGTCSLEFLICSDASMSTNTVRTLHTHALIPATYSHGVPSFHSHAHLTPDTNTHTQ